MPSRPNPGPSLPSMIWASPSLSAHGIHRGCQDGSPSSSGSPNSRSSSVSSIHLVQYRTIPAADNGGFTGSTPSPPTPS